MDSDYMLHIPFVTDAVIGSSSHPVIWGSLLGISIHVSSSRKIKANLLNICVVRHVIIVDVTICMFACWSILGTNITSKSTIAFQA